MSEVTDALNVMPKSTIVNAVINNSDEVVEFGGKTFKILDLPYDGYIEFLNLLTPIIEPIFRQDPNSDIEIKTLITGLGKSLPRMVFLMFNHQDSEVTEEWIKKQAKTPYVLAEIAMKQVTKNRMIAEFADFFVLLMRMMKE